MNELVCVNDYEKLASKILSRTAFDYFYGGAIGEETRKDNIQAFKRWKFRPRFLRDVSNVDTSTTILGQKLPFPICIAPTGMHKMAHHEGELATTRAAFAAGAGYTLSSWATTSIEEISHKVPQLTRWYQLHILRDRELTKRLVQKAVKNGFKALVLTIDIPVLDVRYRDVRNKFALPPNLRLENVEPEEETLKGKIIERTTVAEDTKIFIDASLTWKDVAWLKSITTLPIIMKGIMTREMALEALENGVDAIQVSNHGGRQLDSVTSTIDALPEVVRAVNGRCEVYLDGGIRTGGDVAKAIALGARAVFIGRPILWGLACHGEIGVQNVLKILQDEFKKVMMLLGVRSIRELQTGKNVLVHENHFQSML